MEFGDGKQRVFWRRHEAHAFVALGTCFLFIVQIVVRLRMKLEMGALVITLDALIRETMPVIDDGSVSFFARKG